jgi:hypothetical protein
MKYFQILDFSSLSLKKRKKGKRQLEEERERALK